MSNAAKVVAIIQARMGSTRLPGKVLKDLEGETVLVRVVERVRRAQLIDEVLIATTKERADDAIVDECERCSAAVFRGDENDVLDRYYCAAQMCNAKIVVRITSDCPLIDPEIIDETVAAFLAARPDYASNALVRSYPRGLDTEVLTVKALERAWRGATEPYQRAHVTPYIYQNPDAFRILPVSAETDYSGHRWTLDTPEDLAFIRAIYARVEDRHNFGWRDVLGILDREPELVEMNRMVPQKTVHEG
jgi:spore coat polysaccharide biosynthesis protein SpsF